MSLLTRTPLSRSKVKVTRPLYSPGSCRGERGLPRPPCIVLAVGTYCYVTVCSPLPFPFGRICFVVLVMRKGGESS